MQEVTALGLSAGAANVLANTSAAQYATPTTGHTDGGPGRTEVPASPAPGMGAAPGKVVSIAPPSREEVLAAIREEFELSQPEVTGGQLILGQSSDIRTMNMLLSSDAISSRVAGQVYEYLVALSPIDGGLIPGLADTWEVADDGLTYTFQLNQDVAWHDGAPFTAADVVFSFDITLAEDSLSPVRSTVLEMLESYRAVDDHTVEFVAQDRFATFLENTAFLVAIMPMHIWQDVPAAAWGTDPGSTGHDPTRVVGTGPGIFVERVADDHVTVAKNPDYWDTPYRWNIDELIFRVIPETSAVIQALLTGEVDVCAAGPAVAPTLLEEPEITLTSFHTTDVNWFGTNQDPNRTELFLEIPVRQALMYALDRNLMAEQVYNGYAIQANGTQPVLSVAHAPERIETIFNYDVERARQLLEEAGWVDEDGDGIREKAGVRFSFECLYAPGAAPYEQQLPYMQLAWAEIGVEMLPTAVPFPSLLNAIDTGAFEMAVLGFGWGFDGGQLPMFGCEYLPPQGFNVMHYCNEEYDRLALQAEKTLNSEARVDLLIEASNIVNTEQAAGYLLFRQHIWASRNTLHNFLPNGYATFWSIPWIWTEVAQ